MDVDDEDELREMPESIDAPKPICPYCERPWSETTEQFVDIFCSCGHSFQVERLYISRPL